MGKRSKIDIFILLLIGSLILYTGIRAILVDATNDEAYSFYIMKNFWYAEALCTGNTHWMNSLAIKTAVLFKAESLLQIRWFSCFSAFTFFTVIFLWIRSVDSPNLKFLIAVIALLNPYIIDYLGLARGYAPALMFESLSLFFFFLSLKTQHPKQALLALIFAGLSPISNFSFIYFFMAFTLVYFFVFYFKKGLAVLKTLAIYRDGIYVLAISALVIRAFIFMTKCSNDVVGAGTNDFTESPLVFLHGLFYNREMNTVSLEFLSSSVILLLILSALTGIFRKDSSQNKIYFFAGTILFIILSTIAVLHSFFDVVFPYYRSAIFLFPITVINLVYFFEILMRKYFLKISLYGIGALLVLNFICSINFKSTFDYNAQADLEESFDYLQSVQAKQVGLSEDLYGSYRNYYRISRSYNYDFKGELLNTRDPESLCRQNNALKKYEYLLITPPYNLGYYRNNKVKFKAVKLFKESGSLILKVAAGR